MSERLAKKVLLIGWDAADWKIATPLIDQGLMPHLENLIDTGVMGNPILSPMLWNSIATGKRPDKHGIHGFMEPDAQTGGVRPVSSTSNNGKVVSCMHLEGRILDDKTTTKADFQLCYGKWWMRPSVGWSRPSIC